MLASDDVSKRSAVHGKPDSTMEVRFIPNGSIIVPGLSGSSPKPLATFRTLT